VRVITHQTLEFEFTWWAVLSAFAWIPSGLTTIFSVPIIGVSMSVVINASFSSILSFLVFWLVFGEHIKSHQIGGHSVYLAPAYLFMVCLGMVGLVTAPRVNFKDKDKLETEDKDSEQKLLEEIVPSDDSDDEDGSKQKHYSKVSK
jgi:hypothetical protein